MHSIILKSSTDLVLIDFMIWGQKHAIEHTMSTSPNVFSIEKPIKAIYRPLTIS